MTMSTTPETSSQDASIPDTDRQVEHTATPAKAPPVQDALGQAGTLKAEGTEAFRAGRWNDALASYQAALRCLPKRIVPESPPGPTREDTGDEDDGTDTGIGSISNPAANKAEKGKAKEVNEPNVEEVVDVPSPAVSTADKETARLRAVLYANMGACYVKTGDHKEAAQACSQAILDDPAYVRARERRAAANEIVGTWSSLSSAQEDYAALLQLHTTPAQLADIRRKMQILKPRLEAAQKRETDEMIGKLKGLGNTILGNFGLSTDNFKFEPNGAGGYSLNFAR